MHQKGRQARGHASALVWHCRQQLEEAAEAAANRAAEEAAHEAARPGQKALGAQTQAASWQLLCCRYL